MACSCNKDRAGGASSSGVGQAGLNEVQGRVLGVGTDGEWTGSVFDAGGGVFDWRRDRSGTWSVVDAGRVTGAGNDGCVDGVVRVRWGTVAGTGVEGSRPSASGKNANENWADR